MALLQGEQARLDVARVDVAWLRAPLSVGVAAEQEPNPVHLQHEHDGSVVDLVGAVGRRGKRGPPRPSAPDGRGGEETPFAEG